MPLELPLLVELATSSCTLDSRVLVLGLRVRGLTPNPEPEELLLEAEEA